MHHDVRNVEPSTRLALEGEGYAYLQRAGQPYGMHGCSSSAVQLRRPAGLAGRLQKPPISVYEPYIVRG